MMSILKSIGFEAQTPEGAYYVMADYSNVPSKHSKKDSKSFAVWMTEKLRVAVVPGEVFGCSNFFRISFATSNKNIEEGCKKIISACNKLK